MKAFLLRAWTASAILVASSLQASVVSAIYNTAGDVAVAGGSYTATGNSVEFTLNFAPAAGVELVVVQNTGLAFINGTFDNLAQGQPVVLTFGGVTYDFVANYYGGTGNDLVLAWARSRALAWGDNDLGQLGDNTTTDRSTPVPVTATGALAGKTVVSTAAGGRHSVALCSDGTVVAWGYNVSGQLGDNTTANHAAPVAVNTASGVSALFGKTVVAVAAGQYHSLALCSDGTVAAWGFNSDGQLGDNTSGPNRLVPVAVNTAPGVSALNGRTAVAIAAGLYHSMALCSDGAVVAWGYNGYGQLGDNSTTSHKTPVIVNADNGISALFGKSVGAIAAGGQFHSMALCSDGTVAAWGNNGNGQLGDNSITERHVPVAVNTASGVSALFGKTAVVIAAGFQHSMALCSDGTVAAWGNNGGGALGDNTTTERHVPVAVNTTSGVSALFGKTAVAIAACYAHSMALCSDGTVAAWGSNTNGQIGDNSSTLRKTPVLVDMSALAAGERFTRASIGPGALHSLALLAAPPPPPTVSTLAATSVTTTGAILNGLVNANSSTSSGSFDYGTTQAYGTNAAATPSSITGNSDTAVSATLTGLSPSTIYHFRANGVNAVGASVGVDLTFATLGDVTAIYNSAADVPITTAGSYTGTGHTVNFTLNFAPTPGTELTVVRNTGTGFIDGAFDNLAQGQPVTLTYGGITYSFIATYFGGTGNDLVLVWKNNRPMAWGFHGTGAFGDSTIPVAVTPIGVLAGKTVMATAASQYHSLALCSDGTVAAWGDNGDGELGDNTTTDRGVPVAVNTTSGLSALFGKTVVAVATGYHHSLALCSDGTVAAWGWNSAGQLGDNTTTERHVPVAVNTASGVSALFGKTVVAIAAGNGHNIAVCSDGTAVAWGYNYDGQLGDNTTTSRPVPVAVSAAYGISSLFGKTVAGIAAGDSHSMAWCSDGTVAAWGQNSYGQLGDNTWISRSAPVAVNAAPGVSALSGKTVVSLAGGENHSIALCSDGTVAAWGKNFDGQLGDNTTDDRYVPVAVNTSSGVSALFGKTVVAVAAGTGFSMGLCSDGSAAAWGQNYNGQLGDNTTTDRDVPVAVNSSALASGEGFVRLSKGSTAYHTVAVVAGPPLPVVATMAATSITGTSATLNATVNAHANGTDVSFDYGIDTTYGTSAAGLPTPVTGSSDTPVTATLTGLNPGTTYHFRVHAANVVGTANGSDLTFTTLRANANLASLSLSSGALSPSFSSGTTSYTAMVSNATGSITVTPTVADGTATVKVNGTNVLSGFPSGSIGLAVGDTIITVLVTAQDGTTTTSYTIAVTRPPFAWTYNSVGDVPVAAASYTASGAATLALNFAPLAGTDFTMVKNTGLGFISGTFSNIAKGQAVTLTFGGITYNFVANYYGGSGNDLVLTWAGNRMFAWGSNVNGQLGDNTTTQHELPVPVNSTGALAGKTIVAASSGGTSAGQGHTLALCSDGSVVAWGNNGNGQLGDNTTTERHVPVAVNTTIGISALFGKRVIAVAAGETYSLALCSDGTVAGWGNNSSGQLGDNTSTQRLTPRSSQSFGKVIVAVAAGKSHSVVLCSDGTVAAWGDNSNGQLGDNTTTLRRFPVLVNTTSGISALFGKTVVAIAAGENHSMALCSDGTVTAWGDNSIGQLGDNTTTQQKVPVAVNTTSGVSALFGKTVAAIAAGGSHSLALCSDGTAVAWGYNGYGQLGDNTTTNHPAPVAVNTSSGLSALFGKTVGSIAAGRSHSAAFCTDGTMVAWGNNAKGQLGDGTTTDRQVPTAVSGSPLKANERFTRIISGPTSSDSLTIVAAPPVPVLATLAATSVSSTGATLHGVVNANNNTTNVTFDFGLDQSYGSNIVATPTPVTGNSDTAVLATLTGLAPATTYHFRANGVSAAGAVNSTDLTFATPSANANLADLSLSSGTLNPVFAGGVTSYSASVSTSTSTLTVTPTVADNSASVTVNGVSVSSGHASGVISLAFGANDITTTVTAQDGITTMSYAVTVERVTGMKSWRQTYFPGSTATTGPGADTAIPMNDGINNMIKFATGMDPTVPGTMPGGLARDFDNLVFTYTPSAAAVADGVIFTVEYSDTMAPGTWTTDLIDQGTIGAGGSPVTATLPEAPSGRRFVRLKITSP